jgi:hypothetical protein
MIMFKKDTIVIFILCIVTSIPNGINAMYATEISILNLISTFVFYIFLIIYSFRKGKINSKNFIKYISIYWGIAFIINLICIVYPLTLLYPLAIINFFPSYGIYYFVKFLNNPLVLICINFLICICSFSLGKFLKSNN